MTTGPSVWLLDGFRVSPDGGPAVGGLPHGVQRVIAHLGLCRRPGREAIAGQLWPDVPEARAHGSLRSALWRVQKAVPGLVEVTGDGLALARGVRVDVRELVGWVHAVLDPAVPLARIDRPVTAVAGDLLPGWYDDWVLLERERLCQLRMHALEALADRLIRAGRHGEAVQAAYAAVRDEPLRESAHRVLVRAHLAEGNLAEAIGAYVAFRDALGRELAVAPTAQMQALVAPWCGRPAPPARDRAAVPRARTATGGRRAAGVTAR